MLSRRPLPARAAAAAASAAASAAALALVLADASVLGAQQAPPQPMQRNSIATNILGIPFGLFSFEYERALTLPGLTFGVGGSHFTGDVDDDDFDSDDDRNTWAEAKLQYYPSERAFRGFSVGLTAGVHSARGVACDFNLGPADPCNRPNPPRTSQSGATVGVLANYDRIIGSRERFRVGIGIGAKRVLRDVRQRDVLEQVYPDGRFVVGLTF